LLTAPEEGCPIWSWRSSTPAWGTPAFTDTKSWHSLCAALCFTWRRSLASRLHSVQQSDDLLTYVLMYGAEPFLRSCQLCSHSGNSQQF
jgi:hypothetical protein